VRVQGNFALRRTVLERPRLGPKVHVEDTVLAPDVLAAKLADFCNASAGLGAHVRVLGDALSDGLEVRPEVRLGDGLLVHRSVAAQVPLMRVAVGSERGRREGAASWSTTCTEHFPPELEPVPTRTGVVFNFGPLPWAST